MIAEHAAPIVAALTVAPPSPIRVFDSAVAPNTVPPYVVVYVAVSLPEAVGMEEVADLVVTTARVHSVGGSAEANRNVADWVMGVLLGLQPSVVGRDCGRVKWDDGRQLDVNEETGQRVLSQLDVYRYFSVPG